VIREGCGVGTCTPLLGPASPLILADNHEGQTTRLVQPVRALARCDTVNALTGLIETMGRAPTSVKESATEGARSPYYEVWSGTDLLWSATMSEWFRDDQAVVPRLTS
jgi:hypothetical protein